MAKRRPKSETMPLRLEYLDPADLKKNPRNWRLHPEAQMRALSAVIEEVGWAGALLYNERTQRLIDGHARQDRFAGKAKVPVLIGSWDEETEKKILATLDPLGAMATANKEALAALHAQIETNSDALRELLERTAAAAGIETAGSDAPEPQIDRAAELEAKWKTKPGQLWIIGEHRLLCGDSTCAADVERVLGAEKPFIMVTDPPYGVEYEPGWRDGVVGEFGAAARVKNAVANDDEVDWTPAYNLFPGDVAYVWHASYFTIDVGMNLREAGYHIRASIIWRKQHFAISQGHYHWQHEPCWYAVKKGRTAKWCGDRTQSTVWDIASLHPAGRQEERVSHGTQKPVECMARPIRNHGDKGDSVYDPFLGSGTTMVAAQQLSRRCYGIEISPAYVAVVLQRLADMGLTPKLEKPAGRNGKRTA